MISKLRFTSSLKAKFALMCISLLLTSNALAVEYCCRLVDIKSYWDPAVNAWRVVEVYHCSSNFCGPPP